MQHSFSRFLFVAVFAIAVAVLGVLAGHDSARATGFEPTGDFMITDPAAGANSDIVIDLELQEPDAIFSAVISFIPGAWGLADCPVGDPASASVACADEAIADGSMVGVVESDTVLSLLNGACSTNLDLEFQLMDATTDMSEQVVFHDTDDNEAGEQFEDDDENGIPNGVEMYPDYLTRLIRNVPFGTEGSEPLQPIARLYSQVRVASNVDNTSVQFVVLEPGTTINGLPLHESLGFPVVLVLNNLGDPGIVAQPSSITGFCTPLASTTTIFGTTEDNPNSVAAEGGDTYLTNPPEGTYNLVLFLASEYDADGDGHENPLDECPIEGDTAGWDPRDPTMPGDNDGDGIPNICDPSPNVNTGAFDHDGDQFQNRADTCPLIVNPDQLDIDRDDIGDACDPDPFTPTGHQHLVCLYGQAVIGAAPVGEIPPPQAVPPCVLDQPQPLGDVNCSGEIESTDALGLLQFLVNQQPAPLCIDLADTQCDGDKDSVDALQILRFIAGLDTVREPGCPEVGELVG